LGTATLDNNGKATLTTSSPLQVGSHTIEADYAGDTNSATSTGTVTQTVTQQATSTTVSSSHSPSSYGQSVTFTALVAANTTPGGTVTFKDGTTVLGTATLDATGKATFTTSTLTVGTHTIEADYAGDTNSQASSGTLTQPVTQQATTSVIVSSSNNNTSTYGQDVTFTATIHPTTDGTPTGTVTFKIDGTPLTSGPVTLTGGQATFHTTTLTAGQHTIEADYTGDTNSATSSATLTQTVNKAATTLTADDVADNLPNLVAHLSSNGQPLAGQTITFTTTNLLGQTITLCSATTDNTGTATCTSGALNLLFHLGLTYTATYTGDTNHTASTAHAHLL
ncbi:Ig-like domain-containing protein, partial [Kitasatospora sp. GAS204B]